MNVCSKGKNFDLLFIHSFIHALIHSLSQPMKGAMVHKICSHLNPKAKEYFLIVLQIYWEVMRNVSFSWHKRSNFYGTIKFEFLVSPFDKAIKLASRENHGGRDDGLNGANGKDQQELREILARDKEEHRE